MTRNDLAWGEEPPHSAQPLLHTAMRGGRRTGAPDHWPAARKRFREDLAGLPDSARRIEGPEPVRPVRSEALDHLTASVGADIEVHRCSEHRTAPSDVADPHSATLSVSGQ